MEKHTGLRDLDLSSRWPQKGLSSRRVGGWELGDEVVESFMLQSLQETPMGGKKTS